MINKYLSLLAEVNQILINTRGSQVVRREIANLLFVGSIPTPASYLGCCGKDWKNPKYKGGELRVSLKFFPKGGLADSQLRP